MTKIAAKFNDENVIFQFLDEDGKRYGLSKDGKIINTEYQEVKDHEVTDSLIANFIQSREIDNDTMKYPCLANVEPDNFTTNVESYITSGIANGDLNSEVGISSVHWSALVLVKRTLAELEKLDKEQNKENKNIKLHDVEAE